MKIAADVTSSWVHDMISVQLLLVSYDMLPMLLWSVVKIGRMWNGNGCPWFTQSVLESNKETSLVALLAVYL